MPNSEWVLTFDDGPLPADFTTQDGRSDAEMLQPLADILAVLRSHLSAPIPAVFFLRGPAYPWPTPPPSALMQSGLQMMERDGHFLGLHCYKHDPDMWWGWPLTANQIWADLDACLPYFAALTAQSLSCFRPPYGQGGLSALSWAIENRRRFHRWDVDSEDWLHHPDAGWLRQFVDDAAAHRAYILSTLPNKLVFHAHWPGANDVLLHVSERTAAALPDIIDCICETTRRERHEPVFVVPPGYVQP